MKFAFGYSAVAEIAGAVTRARPCSLSARRQPVYRDRQPAAD